MFRFFYIWYYDMQFFEVVVGDFIFCVDFVYEAVDEADYSFSYIVGFCIFEVVFRVVVFRYIVRYVGLGRGYGGYRFILFEVCFIQVLFYFEFYLFFKVY